jgi:hypothetical protein
MSAGSTLSGSESGVSRDAFYWSKENGSDLAAMCVSHEQVVSRYSASKKCAFDETNWVGRCHLTFGSLTMTFDRATKYAFSYFLFLPLWLYSIQKKSGGPMATIHSCLYHKDFGRNFSKDLSPSKTMRADLISETRRYHNGPS